VSGTRCACLTATLRKGKAEGYPVCCRVRYALEEFVFGRLSEQCLRRGVRFTNEGSVYVPCAILHGRMLTHAACSRLFEGIDIE
jgi:hypothetical protein